MVTTFIEFNDQLVIVRTAKKYPLEMAVILINRSSQLHTQFSSENIPKKLNPERNA